MRLSMTHTGRGRRKRVASMKGVPKRGREGGCRAVARLEADRKPASDSLARGRSRVRRAVKGRLTLCGSPHVSIPRSYGKLGILSRAERGLRMLERRRTAAPAKN